MAVDSKQKRASALNFAQMDDVFPIADGTVDSIDRWQVAGFYFVGFSTQSVKLAQIFGVYGQFSPTKASVYLRPQLGNESGFFAFSNNVSIDSLNFSSLIQGTNKIIPNDDVFGFSGGGYLSVDTLDSTGEYATISYPIQFSSTGQYRLWVRVRTTTGSFKSIIFLDDVEIARFDSSLAVDSWEWDSLVINIDDIDVHTLKFQPTVDGSFMDKIYITSDLVEVVSNGGPDFSAAPYITIHAGLYSVDSNGAPDEPLFIHDYITTIDDLKTDDWYNFDLNFLDSSLAISFSGRYALVLYSSGSDSDKYVVWEVSDSDPDVDGPSAIKV